MDAFLRVNDGNLTSSPTSSFMTEDSASICPLITPSPPTNDLINPPLESTETNFIIGEELADKLAQVHDDGKGNLDSASSSSSALAEPSCTQLLNHRNNAYNHIIKDEEAAAQETNGKVQHLQLTFKNPPDDYFFMSWNWPLIRTISLYLFLSCLVAMLALVIGMISTLPKTCNPHTEWYQGSVFYEIFPGSFYGENSQVGNFKGISQKSEYIRSLGVKAVRLNSIFESPNYPEDFDNISSLTNIASVLGTIEDYKKMVTSLEKRNISLVLDLPLYPLYKTLPKIRKEIKNDSVGLNELKKETEIELALLHWINNKVQGFYLKGLEHFADDPNLHDSLRIWKKIIGPDRIFIVSEEFFNKIPSDKKNIIYNNINLVDVKVNLENGIGGISKQIVNIQNTTLFLQRGMPWVHWSLGNVKSKRLADVLQLGNATLGATLLQMMLPGTPSIFYGDEIGLQSAEVDHDLKHLNHLKNMPWPNVTPKNLKWLVDNNPGSVHFDQVELVSKMAALRFESPSIYMNSVFKEGLNKATAEVKYSKEDFLVIQRWYPRRKAYVVATNFAKKLTSVDLSTLLYSGDIILGPKVDSNPKSISFKDISLYPGESVIIVLD